MHEMMYKTKKRPQEPMITGIIIVIAIVLAIAWIIICVVPETIDVVDAISMLVLTILSYIAFHSILPPQISLYLDGMALDTHRFPNQEGKIEKTVFVRYEDIISIYVFTEKTILGKKHPVGIVFSPYSNYLKYCPWGYLLFSDALGNEVLTALKKIIDEEKYANLVKTISREMPRRMIKEFLRKEVKDYAK